MARVEDYPRLVEDLVRRYGKIQPGRGDIETQLIFDREHGHYQLQYVGWDKLQRVRGCVLHIDIKDGKIWIQHDGTEVGVANELVEMDVPKHDIVLAFHPPYKRPYTGFASN
jgi:hypothetical protein